jgi:hypothetical protein
MSPVKEHALSALAPAVVERAQGRRPSRFSAILAAGAVGTASALVTYRLLRRPTASDPQGD